MRRVLSVLLLIALAAPLFAETPHVEVATWNLEWFNHGQRGFPEDTHGGPAYGPRTAEGLKTIAYLIRKHGLDVVGLQEIHSEADLRELLAYLPGYQMSVVPDRASQHCALLWNPTEASVQILPPLAALAVTSGQRQGLHAAVKAGNFGFDYMVVHLASDDDKVAQQTQLLYSWLHGSLRQSPPQDDDVLLGGDFNLTPRESPLQTLLRDSWLVWCFFGLDPAPPTRPCADKTIDHLFMTWNTYRDQRLGAVDVPREDLEFGSRYRELISDHLPVIQSFRTDTD